jgi:hypothetical protein
MVSAPVPDAGAAARSARFIRWAPVAGRVIRCGTHQGLFVGLAPTDKSVPVAAFHMVRLSAGRTVAWWGTSDLFGAPTPLEADPCPPSVSYDPRPDVRLLIEADAVRDTPAHIELTSTCS